MIRDRTLEVLIRKKLAFPRARVYEAWMKMANANEVVKNFMESMSA